MEAAGRPLVNLSFEQVCGINRLMFEAFGGFYVAQNNNLQNADALHYVLAAIGGAVFGQDPYPTLLEKACALAWAIMKRHVFIDGCKRTAMESARVLLELNGCSLAIDDTVVGTAAQAAECSLSFSGLLDWLKAHIQ
jgi:death-on-curing family protein